MSTFSRMLSAGDLRSDGLANEVVRLVSENPALLADLMEEFGASNPAVRGHAADALEKIARVHPDEVARHLPTLIGLARHDSVAMVRWHLAMTFGHLAGLPEVAEQIQAPLLALLKDPSAFVRSWAITSLCITARTSPTKAGGIARAISPLARDQSAAVAKRARTALRVLTDPEARPPASWLKR
jgi:HEAT repeat protein